MKSRVSKNLELHQSLSMSIEAETPSKDLSHFANRLNEIDDQFRRVEVQSDNTHQPQRARSHENNEYRNETANVYDTFENTYLKDFLNEVKEYNVKKGYRSNDDTQANIVSELQGKKTIARDEIRSVLEEMSFDTFNEENSYEETRVFSTDELNDELDTVISSLDETISLTTISNDEPIIEENQEVTINTEENISKYNEEAIVLTNETHFDKVVIEENDYVEHDIEAPEEESLEMESKLPVVMKSNLDDTFKRNLLEQTQTLQYKIIDQERHLEDMNDVMIRTNRLLHSVISILLLAIFVVIILVVAQLMQ